MRIPIKIMTRQDLSIKARELENQIEYNNLHGLAKKMRDLSLCYEINLSARERDIEALEKQLEKQKAIMIKEKSQLKKLINFFQKKINNKRLRYGNV